MMEPYQNPFSKESQLSGATSQAKKAKLERKKGQTFEKTVQAEFQKDSVKKVRRGHQAGEGGGLGNCDVQGMNRWHWEAKNEKTIRMTDYHRQIKQDCPADYSPGLVYANPLDGSPWVAFPLALKMKFACDLIESAGGTVELPYWVI